MDYNPASFPRGIVMHQRQWLLAVSMVSGLAATLAAQDAAPVPVVSDLKPGQTIKVPMHRSKWDYPKEITLPDGNQLHVVERGDTLWDLGSKYLGNPFAWPQIWELNKWVTDPHWIYPGDHLLVPSGKQAVAQGETPAEVAQLQPDRKRLTAKPFLEEFAYTFQDFLQLPFLVPQGANAYFKEVGAIRISGKRERDRSILGDGDEIFLDGGSGKGLKVGDRLVIQRITKKDLFAPGDTNQHKNLGDVIKQIGVVRVTQVDAGSAIAVIEKSLDAVEVGHHVVRFTEPANLQTHLRTDIVNPIQVQAPPSKVIFIGEHRSLTGPGGMVILDKGGKDGLNVGQVLVAYRPFAWPTGTNAKGAEVKAGTTTYLGQMVVVKVGDTSATCRILRSLQEIEPGDLVTK